MKLKMFLIMIIIVFIYSVGVFAEERVTLNLAAGTRVLPWGGELEKEFQNNVSLFFAFGVTRQTYDISLGMRYYFHQPEESGFFLSGSGSFLYVLNDLKEITFCFPFLHSGIGYEQRFGRFHVRCDVGIMYVPLTNIAPNVNIGFGYDVW